jgi:hypothetical protein
MRTPLIALASAGVALASAGCQSKTPIPTPLHPPKPGQTSFLSAPPPGGASAQGADDGAAPRASGANTNANTTTTRTVEETDLYRLDGNRLYYLNAYRGLMVFDVSNVDQPRLLGRSPIFGNPIDMIVRNGIATVVVSDWYGQAADGTPFHGSVVRGLDATDPTNIRVLGEAAIAGWVYDDRVVGDVIYLVSIDYGWSYGWFGFGPFIGDAPVGAVGGGGGATQPVTAVVVSSVDFAGGAVNLVGNDRFPGYTGIFNVTPNSILLAHDVATSTAIVNANGPSQSELLYLDISDPAGAIVRRGAITVDGRPDGWGADNGRWNLDFADGRTAHVVGCARQWCGSADSYVLATADFSNPDAPVLASELTVPSPGWSIAARFDTGRLYLMPSDYSVNANDTTPLEVYDTSNPAAPFLAGTATVPGTVWNILLAPNHRIFALGNDWSNDPNNPNNGEVSLKYIDVSDIAHPSLLGTSTFGRGWAWTPAAGTFKAFTMDASRGLVVLPFSGWDSTSDTYNNGLQLIEFTDGGERTSGTAHTKGWVERGIFVQNRLVSLSDLALAVIDYSNHDQPNVVTELTLARNVISARPEGDGLHIVEVSSDWWDNDLSSSQLRVLPIDQAEELSDVGAVPSIAIDGVGAKVFTNGQLAYVVSNVQQMGMCMWGPCYQWSQKISVIDLSNNGATLRGQVQLPFDGSSWWWWWGVDFGWVGYFWWDWYGGDSVVQVGSDAIALRRFGQTQGQNGQWTAHTTLTVVDLSNPDSPSLASVDIADPSGWWGNMRVVGGTLYTTHYEVSTTTTSTVNTTVVRYFVDRIDLSNRAQPSVAASINVPGMLVGGSETDPSLLYFIDYRWQGTNTVDDFDAVQVSGNTATLLSTTPLSGWVGSTFVQGTKAYLSAQQYNWNAQTATVALHAIDLTDPSHPVDRISSGQNGFGWLLDVVGDRALVSSGWGEQGVDIYTLADGQAPAFSQFVRTRGWSLESIARLGNRLYFASGYWGVQRVDLP